MIGAKRFFEIRRALVSFSFRDIQQYGVIDSQAETCGIGHDELVEFSRIAPTLFSLEREGYFLPEGSVRDPARLKTLKKLESLLPKEVRSEFRKARLESIKPGKLKGK